MLEVVQDKMEVERSGKIGRKRRRRNKKRGRGPRIEWVKSSAAALPPSRARRRRFDLPSFIWREVPLPDQEIG